MTHLILHAGQHKTGSSSIQQFLCENRELFRQHGHYIPKTGMSEVGSHRAIIKSLTGGPQKHLQRQLADELSREQPTCTVLSAEVAKLEIVAGRGDKLIEGLKNIGAETIEILMYLRAPFALANSAFSQRTGNLMGKGHNFQEHIAGLLQEGYFDYQQIISLASRHDISLSIRAYSGTARLNVVGDFMNALGLPGGELSAEPRLNLAFGPIGLEAMRRIRLETGELSQPQRIQLRNRLNRIAHNLGESPYWGVDDEIRNQLQPADAQTDEFTLSIWNKPWREILDDEQKPLNVFDPKNDAQMARYQRVLSRMRAATEKILSSNQI